MPNLFELFKYSKLLELNDGRLGLMGVNINIVPTSILADLQKGLIDSLGLEKAYQKTYESAKKGSLEYNSKYIQKQGFVDKRKIIDWQAKIVTFAGWGNVEIAKIDFEKEEYYANFKNSPFPEVYGKANHPIDFIVAGFIAGAFEASLKKPLDCVEIKCRAKGDPYCEFFVSTPEAVKVKQKEWILKTGKK